MTARSAGGIDRPLIALGAVLALWGISALYSASAAEAFSRYGSTSFYVLHQIRNGGLLGLLGGGLLAWLDYRSLKRFVPVVTVGALLCLVLVKVPGIGFGAGGAERWIHVGSLFFQPAELAKLALVLYLAAWVERRGDNLRGFAAFVPPMLVTACFAGLVLWQPDFGTMLVLLAAAAATLFSGGVPGRYFAIAAAAGALLLVLLVAVEPYRAARLSSFFDPNRDPSGAGYQPRQALIAVGSGGWWGLGYGLSRQKYQYLPEVIGDSIFAATAEELGFVRTLLLLACFALFLLRTLTVAARAPDAFGRMVAAGVAGWIGSQVLLNVAATVQLVPLTGVPLPFFSYGSTSLMISMWAIGIVLSISRRSGNRNHRA